MEITLELERRHSPACPDRKKGPKHLKCSGRRPCVLRAVGYDAAGRRIRESLDTRDQMRGYERLLRLAERLKAPAAPVKRKNITAAIAGFLEYHSHTASETQRKYRRLLQTFGDYCGRASLDYVDQVTVEALDGYVIERRRATWGWLKESELLKQFLRFCAAREWAKVIDLKVLRPPKLEQANDVTPYTSAEVVKIIAACDGIGRSSYERLRARTMILLMRYAGLRISDVVTLTRDNVQGRYLVKRAVKNGARLRIELRAVVLEALDRLPRPKAAPQECKYYFSSGNASVRSLVKGAERTLSAVFERAGVERAHAHRFRHTLASELMGRGEAIEVVASILGDSPAIIRRHYAKSTPEYQIRQDAAIRTIDDTDLAQAEDLVRTC